MMITGIQDFAAEDLDDFLARLNFFRRCRRFAMRVIPSLSVNLAKPAVERTSYSITRKFGWGVDTGEWGTGRIDSEPLALTLTNQGQPRYVDLCGGLLDLSLVREGETEPPQRIPFVPCLHKDLVFPRL